MGIGKVAAWLGFRGLPQMVRGWSGVVGGSMLES